MSEHPFTKSVTSKIVGSILIALAILAQWGILIIYCNGQLTPSLIDSILTITLLTASGYMLWYLLSYVRVWQVQLIVALLVQFVCLGVSFMVMAILGFDTADIFLRSLPLRFLFGLLSWIILLQWYGRIRESLNQTEIYMDREVDNKTATDQPVSDERIEYIDRISVKDGSRIHIVHTEELICLQASGDYVTLFTPDGQYIKEQTMKYFEQHLPATFVRIHRSSIVNSEFIQRVELFGKENYRVKLKNGTSLRASNSGYKLLKERLAL